MWQIPPSAHGNAVTPTAIRHSSEKLVRRDRQLADALPGRMEDRVRDGWRNADHGDLAHSLYPEWVHVRVVLLHEDCLHHWWGVGVHRHRVLGKVRVRDAAIASVHNGVLHQRHADPADHSADALASGGLRVNDPPGPI